MSARYRTMIQGMVRKIKKSRRKMEEPWYLYLLRCRDGSLYTGITKNLTQRVKKHNEGRGATYTRTHRPVRLIYHEICANRMRALVREFEVKAMGKKKKEALVRFS